MLVNLLKVILGILVGLLSLGLMMFVHELGHYLVGRLLGFKIIEFSIFMGPRLASWESKGIRYSLKLLPIGASVEFAGEGFEDSGEEKEKDKTEETVELSPEEKARAFELARENGEFHAMPLWKRALTILAGPGMNLLTAFLIMLIYFGNVGVQLPVVTQVMPQTLAAQAEIEEGDRIVAVGKQGIKNPIDLTTATFLARNEEEIPLTYISAKTGDEVQKLVDPSPIEVAVLGITLEPNSVGGIRVLSVDAELNNAGDPNLLENDMILEINGHEANYDVLQAELAKNHGESLDLRVLRDGEEIEIQSKPTLVTRAPALGVGLEVVDDWKYVPKYSFDYGVSVIRSTAQLLGEVFTGGLAVKDAFSGPVGIVSMYSGIVSSEGINFGMKVLQWLSLTFMISLALGFGNLLPIPPLDGGILLFLIIEGILGRPVNPKVQYVVQMIGIVFVLILAVYIFGLDIWRLIK